MSRDESGRLPLGPLKALGTDGPQRHGPHSGLDSARTCVNKAEPLPRPAKRLRDLVDPCHSQSHPYLAIVQFPSSALRIIRCPARAVGKNDNFCYAQVQGPCCFLRWEESSTGSNGQSHAITDDKHRDAHSALRKGIPQGATLLLLLPLLTDQDPTPQTSDGPSSLCLISCICKDTHPSLHPSIHASISIH